MWIPRDASEIEEAVARGDLEETASFDAKADLPRPGKNASLAVDVAAMSTDGGLLLYGVAEDENGRPVNAKPILLAGAADRISQIAATSIAEVPHIEVREHPTPDDPAKGYISVLVPQSARAPHQVIVGNDMHFYGRSAKGNRRLSEGEIARLYERRSEWERNRDELLAEAIAQAPFSPHVDRAYLHGFARPVAPDRVIWDRALAASGGQQELQKQLGEAAGAPGPQDRYSPNLKSILHWTRRGADEWCMSSTHNPDYSDPEDAAYLVDVRLNIDGRGHLFCGRAAERIRRQNRVPEGDPDLVILESVIAGNFAAFLVAMGKLYELGGYHGQVDIGLAATGLRGGYTATRFERPFAYADEAPYNADSYPRTERIAARELGDPEQVAGRMLRHLFEATTGDEAFEPFAARR
jgi:hypothetical protein